VSATPEADQVNDTVDEVAARLARWAERDAAVGLDAELTQVRHRLTESDAEVRDLRARVEQLGNRVTQLELERSALQHQVVALQRVPLSRRVYRKARSVAGRALRR
jgi:predicted  nucleic acid-binding Zn-ribbon protein